MSKGCRIARVVKLSQHLRIGKNVPRVAAPQFEKAPEEGWLVHTGHKKNIARNRGLDEGVENVTERDQTSGSSTRPAALGYPP